MYVPRPGNPMIPWRRRRPDGTHGRLRASRHEPWRERRPRGAPSPPAGSRSARVAPRPPRMVSPRFHGPRRSRHRTSPCSLPEIRRARRRRLQPKLQKLSLAGGGGRRAVGRLRFDTSEGLPAEGPRSAEAGGIASGGRGDSAPTDPAGFAGRLRCAAICSVSHLRSEWVNARSPFPGRPGAFESPRVARSPPRAPLVKRRGSTSASSRPPPGGFQ